jgi:hypothetical protein
MIGPYLTIGRDILLGLRVPQEALDDEMIRLPIAPKGWGWARDFETYIWRLTRVL